MAGILAQHMVVNFIMVQAEVEHLVVVVEHFVALAAGVVV
jgi:hypothetical protein